MQEIDYIVGGDSSLKFALETWEQTVGTIVSTIQDLTCNEPARLDPQTTVNTTLPANTMLYLQYNNVTEPLDLVVNSSTGSVTMCYSYRERNPRREHGKHDGCASAMPGGGSMITVYPNSSASTVYVGCERGGHATGGDNDNEHDNYQVSGSYCKSPVFVNGVLTWVGGGSKRCFSCPEDTVMLSDTGSDAGVCAAACPRRNQWVAASGKRVCTDCHVSCDTCAAGGTFRDCTSCPSASSASVLLLNVMDASTSDASAYATGTGRCVAACPAPFLRAPAAGNASQWECVYPSPSPSPTPSRSPTPSTS
ncbi:hypothetical protein EON67_06515, partial [archaeon]